MFIKFEDFQEFGKKQLDTVTAAAVSTGKGLQAIVTETTDYSKKTFDKNAAHAQKLFQVKKPDEFLELQSNFAKAAYEDFVAQATKISQLYSDLGKEAFSGLTKDASWPVKNGPAAPFSAAAKAPATAKQS